MDTAGLHSPDCLVGMCVMRQQGVLRVLVERDKGWPMGIGRLGPAGKFDPIPRPKLPGIETPGYAYKQQVGKPLSLHVIWRRWEWIAG